MRTTLRSSRGGALLATAGVAAALSLTACSGGGAPADAAASASSHVSTAAHNAAAKDGGTTRTTAGVPSAASTTGGSGAGATAGATTGSGGATTGSAAASASRPGDDCTLDKVTVKLAGTGGTMPAVLLELTNNGSHDCSAYNAPIVSDPVAGRNLPVNKDTVPQAVVTLSPGQTAYAGINLAGGDSAQSHRARTLNVTLENAEGQGTDGHVTVRSPGSAGLALDSHSQVTYWQSTEELALQ